MKRETFFTRAFIGISAAVITAAIIIAVLLVYRTFQRSVEADIYRYSRELEQTVVRTASTEYRRYLMMRNFGKSIHGLKSDEQLQVELEQHASIFFPDGDMPAMFSSIGYFYNDRLDTAHEFDFNSGQWTDFDNIFDQKDTERDVSLDFSGNGERSGDFYMSVKTADPNLTVFFRIDQFNFVDVYIKGGIEFNTDNLKLEWFRSTDEAMELNALPLYDIELHYRFRPFKILLAPEHNAKPLIIEIPGFLEFRKMDEGEEDDRELPPMRPGVFRENSFVKLTHNNGSFYHEIEHRAALNFIETLIIFIVLGVLLLLLLFQLQRTRMLRSKEKEFVASVTHELRTPLTVIRSAADNLSTGIIPTEKLKVYGGLITEQSDRLGNMIEEILLYSKFEDKRRKTESPVNTEFADLLEPVRSLLDMYAAPAGVELHWDTKGLPKSGSSYPEIIKLAVNNLVTNAVNHAYAGSGENTLKEIRIKFRMLIPDKLEITVEDDGRGIESRELKRIFDPFYRDRISRERQEKGSGLGLFLLKRKAAVVGGRLTAESPYRRIDGSRPSGCRFKLILPCGTEENYNG